MILYPTLPLRGFEIIWSYAMLRVINNVGLSLATNMPLYVLPCVCNKDSENTPAIKQGSWNKRIMFKSNNLRINIEFFSKGSCRIFSRQGTELEKQVKCDLRWSRIENRGDPWTEQKLNKKNTSWKGNFNIPACALPTYLQSPAFTRGRRSRDFLNTLERFLFVRDSGRHWGITSSFLPSSTRQLRGHWLI